MLRKAHASTGSCFDRLMLRQAHASTGSCFDRLSMTSFVEGCPALLSTTGENQMCCPLWRETVSQLHFLSFRASEARHGIQENQLVLDTGLRRYDDFYADSRYCDTASGEGGGSTPVQTGSWPTRRKAGGQAGTAGFCDAPRCVPRIVCARPDRNKSV